MAGCDGGASPAPAPSPSVSAKPVALPSAPLPADDTESDRAPSPRESSPMPTPPSAGQAHPHVPAASAAAATPQPALPPPPLTGTAADAALPPPDSAAWHGLLEGFYARHNPAKLAGVGQMLKQFAGQEAELWGVLHIKYNVLPAAVADTVAPPVCADPSSVPPAPAAGDSTPAAAAQAAESQARLEAAVRQRLAASPSSSPSSSAARRTGSPRGLAGLMRPTASFSGKTTVRLKDHVILTVAKGTAKTKTGITCDGTVVTGVAADSPAARAGLRVGMQLLTVDGVPLDGASDVAESLRRAGETFTLCARCAGDSSAKQQAVAVPVPVQPQQPPAPPRTASPEAVARRTRTAALTAAQQETSAARLSTPKQRAAGLAARPRSRTPTRTSVSAPGGAGEGGAAAVAAVAPPRVGTPPAQPHVSVASRKTSSSALKEKAQRVQESTWSERDFWPAADPKFQPKKTRTASPAKKAPLDYPTAATATTAAAKPAPSEASPRQQPLPGAAAAAAAAAEAEARSRSLAASQPPAKPRFHDARKPALPAAATTPTKRRTASPSERSRHSAASMASEEPWRSVLTRDQRGAPTATELFEQKLAARAAEHQREVERENERRRAKERVWNIEKRILQEEVEKTRRLEAKLREWDDLVKKKENVSRQRAGRARQRELIQ